MEEKPGFDRRTFLAIVLCIGIYLGWQQYLQKKYPNLSSRKTVATEEKSAIKDEPPKSVPTSPQSQAVSKLNQAPPKVLPKVEKLWTYEDELWKVTVSSRGGRISEILLKKYLDANGPIVHLSKDLPGFLVTDLEGVPNASNLDFDLNALSGDKIELSAMIGGLKLTKLLSFGQAYVVKVHTELSGNLEKLKSLNFDVASQPPKLEKDASAIFGIASTSPDLQEFYFSHGTKTDRLYVEPETKTDQSYDQTNLAAVGSRYFTTLFSNRASVIPMSRGFDHESISILRLSYPILEKRSPFVTEFDLYAGPKLSGQLKRVNPAAVKVIDYGMFSALAFPMLSTMNWFYSVFKNWGVAIILLTILVRLITFPFNYISYKSMKAMQKIQPEIARLKEIYKEDKVRQQQEMLKIMRDNKANPMSGCLPMLLQFPVFLALFQLLQNSIDLYRAPFIFWIHDLSVKDPYFVLPILMGATMFIQQKMTPTAMDPTQARVMLIMPIIFSFFMASLPSGLTLYIFVSTLFGIVQQAVMMRDSAPNQAIVRRAEVRKG